MADEDKNKDGNPFYCMTEAWDDPIHDPKSKAWLYRKAMEIDPNNLRTREYDFHGAQSNCFKIDSMVLECLENPDDGYRSHMDMLIIHPEQQMSGFFDTPIARVRFEVFAKDEMSVTAFVQPSWGDYDEVEGWKVVDINDGHTWLELGTKNYKDYYPMFWFYYNPKKGVVR